MENQEGSIPQRLNSMSVSMKERKRSVGCDNIIKVDVLHPNLTPTVFAQI